KAVRVQSAGPRGQVWDRLSAKEKKLAFHLIQAGRAGRDLLFYQTHRHSLAIKHWLEEALSAEHLQETRTLLGDRPFQEFLIYAANFQDQAGPYASANRKYILREVTPAQVAKLLERPAPSLDRPTRAEVVRLLTDPAYEVQEYPENPDGQG